MLRQLLALSLALSLAPVFLHPGRTDSNGGHYDRSTGEYHYHHGYPAHQHTDLDGDGKPDCPYEFRDATTPNPTTGLTNLASTTPTRPASTRSFGSSSVSDAASAFIMYVVFSFAFLCIVRFIISLLVNSSPVPSPRARVQQDPPPVSIPPASALPPSQDPPLPYCLPQRHEAPTEPEVDWKSKYHSLKEQSDRLQEIISSAEADHRKRLDVSEARHRDELKALESSWHDRYVNLESRSSAEIAALQSELSALEATESAAVSKYRNLAKYLVQSSDRIYGKNYLLRVSGAPLGVTLDDKGLPHLLSGKPAKDCYILYVSNTGKFHDRRCQHFPSCNRVHACCVSPDNFNANRCQTCRPEYPDLQWFKTYSRIVDALQK